jgi:2-methylcitrate dehydratase PrpD
MAQGGYTSSEKTLEAKRGWANVVGSSKADILQSLDKWVGGEGEFGLVNNGVGRWEILRNSFKPFPCGIVIHPVIDACAQLHGEIKKNTLDVHNIKSVIAKVHPLVLELTGKKTPKDGLEAKFSVYHSGACGILFGKATPAEYEDGVVRDPEVIIIRDRITAEIDSTLTPDQTTVTVELKDGQVFTKTIEHAIGSLEVPLDETMLQTKFLDQCIPVLGDGATAASKACWEIETAKDICNITQFM